MIFRNAFLVLLAFGLSLGAVSPVSAEDDTPPPSPVAEEDDKYSAEELFDIVGPVALYPDIVLSSLLPASTMPMDVIQAARWLEKQEGEVTSPPEDSGWDGSVEALVQFPDVLLWMNENLDWMEQLGYAVAVQSEDVLAAIQEFRAETKDAGNLETNDKQEIVVTNENTIEIQPADPEIVYVPQYQPTQVVYASTGTSSATSFWTGFAAGAVGAWAVHSIRWGGGGHYGGGSINVNRSPTYNFNNNGNINRGNVGSGNTFRASSGRGTGRPANRPAGGAKQPKARKQGGANNRARTSKGGVKPGKNTRGGNNRGGGNRSSGSRPGGSRPGGATTRPSKAPGAGSNRAGGSNRSGSGNRAGGSNRSGSGSRGGSSGGRSSSKATKSSKSAYSGSKRSGSSSRNASSRGKSSRSSSSRSSSSRSRSSGGSRGGGGRGGGGGGRRR